MYKSSKYLDFRGIRILANTQSIESGKVVISGELR